MAIKEDPKKHPLWRDYKYMMERSMFKNWPPIDLWWLYKAGVDAGQQSKSVDQGACVVSRGSVIHDTNKDQNEAV